MDDGIANDNMDPLRPNPGAQEPAGYAALLLVESLLHGMIERGLLSVGDAIDITDVAAEVKAEIAEEIGDTPSTMRQSLVLLRAISASLKPDRQD